MTSDLLRDRVIVAVGEQYDIQGELGRGGMSIVFRALDLRLQRHVAIKVLPPEFAFDAGVRERFQREAQMSAHLSHPNIVPIHAVDEREGIAFFVMALCDGPSLGAVLARHQLPPFAEVRRILSEVAGALAYAHSRGVVHRDIKPDNILLDRESGRAMVTDFGIARAAEGGTRLTVTGVAVGTPAYMSPEQALGETEIDGRSDIYSLGVVGYHMVCGAPPFVASNTPAMLMKHVAEQPARLEARRPDVPPGLAWAIERALAKRPEERWRGAAEFRDAVLDERTSADRHDARSIRAGAPDGPQMHVPVPRDAAPPFDARSFAEQHGLRPPGAGARGRMQELEYPLERHPGGPEPARGWTLVQDPYRIRERIRTLRHRVVAYIGIGGALLALNAAVQGDPWFVFPCALFTLDLFRRIGGLWADGVSPWHVFRLPPADDVVRYATPAGAGWGAEPRGARWAGGSAAGRGVSYEPSPGRGFDRDGGAPFTREAAWTHDVERNDQRVWSERHGKALDLSHRLRRQTVWVAGSLVASFGAFVMTAATRGHAWPLFAASVLPVGYFAGKWIGAARAARRMRVSLWGALTGHVMSRDDEERLRAQQRAFAVESSMPADVLSGPYGDLVRRAESDRLAIVDVVSKLAPEDRALLPDVLPTVDSLVARVESLAPTLHRLDADVPTGTLQRVRQRIADAQAKRESSPDVERTLELLERQRSSLEDLVQRRDTLLAQLESAALLLQNMKLDLLKIRSAGVRGSIDDVVNVTQEARALSRELGHVIGAAAEVRAME
jgi:serine/threonine-protein kinase